VQKQKSQRISFRESLQTGATTLDLATVEGRVPLGAKSVFGERWGELMADGEGS